MRISAYLQKASLTPSEFGRQIGVSRQAVYNYMHRGRRPAFDILLRIDEVTKGQVSFRDFDDRQSLAA